jgi:choline dehydrogenase-like flavoprotein
LPGDARVLVLERGPRLDHAWQVAHRRNSSVDHMATFRSTGDPDKDWLFNIGFGGSSNCWYADTPRFLPNDFRMRSAYGIGMDWPLGYDDLAPWYGEVEAIMSIAGDAAAMPYQMDRPYPQPPHRGTAADELLRRAFPGSFCIVPTARARLATGDRNACCAMGICRLCPTDAKFTILNGMAAVYADPRVQLETGAEVTAIDIAAGTARGVRYRREGAEHAVRGDLVALGANGIFNPFLLLRSGYAHPALGRYLHEQTGLKAIAKLAGLEHFQGSTIGTGYAYMLYDGPHRRERAGVMFEIANKPEFRMEPGRLREQMPLLLTADELALPENRVEIDPENPERPLVIHAGPSRYALDGLAAARTALPGLLATLPVEEIEFAPAPLGTVAHVQGTVRMGDDPATSVVDDGLLCHDVRNLAVLGSSAFPSCAAANPTLTLAALSLRAAAKL